MSRLDELLAKNAERFKCQHGVTMHQKRYGQPCAGSWSTCVCCNGSMCAVYGSDHCRECR